MDSSPLSKAETTQKLRSPLHARGPVSSLDNFEEVIEELHVQRVELEMQNRALREAEVEIESSLQRYCDLYDHLPIGYVTLTRKGRIVQTNLTAAGWLRCDRAQLIGSYLNWFLDAFDAGRFAAHLDACVQSGDEQTLEATLRLESGLLLTVQLTSRLAPSGDDGEPQVHTAMTNIPRLKQARAIVNDIKSEQEEVTQSISEYVHAPPATISKFARALLQEPVIEGNVEVKNMVERMECAALRMETTLRDLLQYCALGHEEVTLDPVNLDELVQHIVMEHRCLIQLRGATVTIDRPLPCVRGARLLLGQVLTNVVTNALKHTKPEEKPRLRISATQHDTEVVLSVTDERMMDDGRPEEEQFRLFERMHDRGCFQGAGIGIAIIRGAVERMNGRVWVEPGSLKGTRFNIGLRAV